MLNVLENAMVKSAGAAVTMFLTAVWKNFGKNLKLITEQILKPVQSYEEWNQTNLVMLNKIYCQDCFRNGLIINGRQASYHSLWFIGYDGVIDRVILWFIGVLGCYSDLNDSNQKKLCAL